MSSKIHLENVSYSFSRGTSSSPAFKDLSFSVMGGEFVSVVGPSGCGKTTLLSCIAGFLQPTRGKIFVDDHLILKPGPGRGFVFQSFALFDWLTVRQNVEFGLRMTGVSRSERRSSSDELLAMVGLSEFSEHYPYQLSGGMKQRTAIARALATDPDILLMDEPFAALDAQSREMMQEELVRIWERTQKTILFVTHSLDEAIFISSKVLVLTARPGTIKTALEVSLPAPRYDPHIRTSAAFMAAKASIADLVREETLRQLRNEPGS